jgi:hypothetical protein
MNIAPKTMAFEPIESTLNPKSTSIASTMKDNQPTVTTQFDNAKIDILSRDNNRPVSSIARELSGGEVVISLH